MKKSITMKMFALAAVITMTATMTASNANAGNRLYISNPGSGCQIAPRVPVLGIYGFVTCRGMVITDVVRGSAACRIGLERGDVIVKIDGRRIHDNRDYEIAMRRTGRRTCLQVLDSRGRGIVTVHARLNPEPVVLR